MDKNMIYKNFRRMSKKIVIGRWARDRQGRNRTWSNQWAGKDYK